MPTINISPPDSMKVYVEKQLDSGAYSTASEYIRALIREDQKHKAQEKLEAMLLDGIPSGRGRKLTSKDLGPLRKEIRARLGERRKRAK